MPPAPAIAIGVSAFAPRRSARGRRRPPAAWLAARLATRLATRLGPAVVVAASLSLAGCGASVTIAGIFAASAGGGGGSSTVIEPVSVETPTVTRTDADTVEVSFTARGPEGASASFRVERADAPAGVAGPITAPQTTSVGGGGGGGSSGAGGGSVALAQETTEEEELVFVPVTLSAASGGAELIDVEGAQAVRATTSSAGSTFSLTWDLAADGITEGRRIILRVVPLEPVTGGGLVAAVARAGTTAVVAIGDNPPELVVEALSDPEAERSGTIALRYSLFDIFGDLAAVQVRFSLDGGVTFEAEDAFTPVSQTEQLLTTNPQTGGAFTHTFVWDSKVNAASKAFQGAVLVRLTPSDIFATGSFQDVTVQLDNDVPPTVLVDTPQRSVTGDVTVSFALRDVDDLTANVRASFVREGPGAGSSGPAKLVAVDGAPVAATSALLALAASEVGVAHTATWLYADDVGAGASKVRFELVPFDETDDEGAKGQSGLFVTGNTVPVASIDTPSTLVGDDVLIDFSLFDDTEDSGSIALAFSIDAGQSFQAAELATADSNLITQDAGGPRLQQLTWDSRASLPDQEVDVILRLTPSDAFGAGVPVFTESFPLDNLGNRAPGVVVGGIDRTIDGSVVLPFTLSDADAGDAGELSVALRFSLDGGASFADLDPANLTGPRTGLTGAPGGTAHTLAWDYESELGDLETRRVVIEITAADSDGFGAPARSQELIVGNSKPDVAGLTDGRPLLEERSGNVAFNYTLLDDIVELCSVSLAFQTAGAATPSAATIVVSPTANLLSADPADRVAPFTPFSHTIVWNSLADAGSKGFQGEVLVTLTATDPFGAVDTTSFTLQLDNNRVPAVQVETPDRSVTGEVTVTLTASDPEGDAVNLLASFIREDGGLPASGNAKLVAVNGAPISPVPSDPVAAATVTGLAAPIDGQQHTLTWRYVDDVGAGGSRVRFRLLPSDLTGDQGALAQSGGFTTGNDAPTVTAVVTPAGGIGGNFPISFQLDDSTLDSGSVALFYATNGPAFDDFLPATLSSSSFGFPTDGSTSTVFWDSDLNLPDFDGQVRLMLVPSDAFDQGPAAFTTTPPTFRLDNLANRQPFITLDATAVPRTTTEVASGLVTIPFTVFDADAPAGGVDVTVRFSANGGPFETLDETNQALLQDILADDDGIARALVWDFAKELTGTSGPNQPVPATRIRLELTPNDGAPGIVLVTGELLVGNNPPDADGLTDGLALVVERSGNVAFNYTILDGERDLCSATLTFDPAGPLGASPATIVVSQTTNLLSQDPSDTVPPPSAFPHTIVWNSAADANSQAFQGVVDLTLTVTDAFGASDTALFQLSLDNNLVPAVQQIEPPQARAFAAPGDVTVSFVLSDPEDDLTNVAATFVREGPGSSSSGSAKLVAVDGAPITAGSTVTGLTALRTGSTHTATWRFGDDIGLTGSSVRFRLLPSDASGDPGALAQSGAFVVGNDAPTVTDFPTPADGIGGNFPITFKLADSTLDSGSVALRYATNAPDFDAFQPATLSSATFGFPTDGATTNTVFWDSDVNLANFDGQVKLELVPSDAFAGGPPAFTTTPATFRLDNLANRQPFITLDATAVPRTTTEVTSGVVTIPFIVFDADAPAGGVDVTVRFSANGGPFEALDETNQALLQDILADDDGIARTLVWDFAKELTGTSGPNQPVPATRIRLELTPNDGGAGPGNPSGIVLTTAELIVGNDAPIVTDLTDGRAASFERAGDIAFGYRVLDPVTGDLVSVGLTFDLDGAGALPPLDAEIAAISQTTNLLSRNPANATEPFQHSIVWKSLDNLASSVFQGPVTMTLTATDAFGATGSATFVAVPPAPAGTPQFLLDNNEPSVVQGETPARSNTGTVTGVVTVKDREANDADLAFAFIREGPGGTSTGPASIVAIQPINPAGAVIVIDPPLSTLPDVPTSAAGRSYNVTWKYDAPLNVGTGGSFVRLVVQAEDNSGDKGDAATTGQFITGNTKPVGTITKPADGVGGTFGVAITLADDTGDTCSAQLDFATGPDFTNFQAATLANSNTGLATPTSGAAAPHSLSWNTAADLPNQQVAVVLRLTPADNFVPGDAVVTASFIVNNLENRPLVTLTSFPRTPAVVAAGTVTIGITLTDGDGDGTPATVPVDLDVFFQREGDAGFTELATASDLTALAADANGEPHSIVWDFAAALGVTPVSAVPTTQVRLQFVPSDATGPGVTLTTPFLVVGNNAPNATNLTDGNAAGTAGGKRAGNVALTVQLFDDTADLGNLALVVDPAGPIAPFSAAISPVTPVSSLLGANPLDPSLPFTHTIVWESAADVGGAGVEDTQHFQGLVTLTLTSSDGFGGTDATPATFEVLLDNNAPPSAITGTPTDSPRSVDGFVTVPFTLRDANPGDTARIEASFERVGPPPLPGSGNTGAAKIDQIDGVAADIATTFLGASAAGVPHTIRWHYGDVTQLGLGTAQVKIKLLAKDGNGESDVLTESQEFTIGNDPPVAVVTTPSGPGGAGTKVEGNVELDYTLFDKSADAVTAEFFFSTDEAGGFPDASFQACADGVEANLIAGANAAAPEDHTFVWKSRSNLPNFDGNVRLRVVPRDQFAGGQGTPVTTATFRLDNISNRQPTATSGPVVRTGGVTGNIVTGVVSLSITVDDPDLEPVDLAIRYKVEGFAFTSGDEFEPLTTISDLDGLDSSPGANTHTVVWDYGAQLGADLAGGYAAVGGEFPARSIRLEVTPSDAAGTGVVFLSPPFFLGNDKPEFLLVGGAGERGNVAVAIRSKDSTSDPVDMLGTFSITVGAVTKTGDVESFVPKTPPGVPPAFDPLGLPSSPAGTIVAFTWDTFEDVGVLTGPITVTFVPRDSFGRLGAPLIRTFSLKNDSPTTLQILSIGGDSGLNDHDGRIPVVFALFDEEAGIDQEGPSGRVSVSMRLTVDGQERVGTTAELSSVGLLLREGGRNLGPGSTSLTGLRAREFAAGPATGSDSNIHVLLLDVRDHDLRTTADMAVEVELTPAGGRGDRQLFRLENPADLFGALNEIVPSPGEFVTMALGDINEDGRIDVVTQRTVPGGAVFEVRFGLALPNQVNQGVLNSPTFTTDLFPQASRLALEDLDRDGHLDLILSGAFGVRVKLGDGLGVFDLESFANGTLACGQILEVVDIDRDGLRDIVVSHSVSPGAVDACVLFGTLGGGFTAPVAVGFAAGFGGDIEFLAIGDFNSDGRLDLLRSQSIGESELALNATGRTFDPPQRFPVDLEDAVLIDLDGDGQVEISDVNAFRHEVRALDGTELARDFLFTFGHGHALPDLNGDGRLDVVIGNNFGNQVFVHQGLGFELIEHARVPNFTQFPASTARQFEVVDLDNDGVLDLVQAWNVESPTFRLGRSFATVRFEPTLGGVGGFPGAPDLDVGDLDNDGLLDLLASGVVVARGNGAGAFGPPTFLSSFTAPSGSLADFDGDGQLDVATAHRTSTESGVRVYLDPTDSTVFTPIVDSLGLVDPDRVLLPLVAAELDGGPGLDLVAQVVDNFGSSVESRLVVGAAGGSFVDTQLLDTFASLTAEEPRAADLDGDLDVDIVGNPSFLQTPGGLVAVADSTSGDVEATSLSDLDGDGHIDLIASRDDGFSFPAGFWFRGAGGGRFLAQAPVFAGASTLNPVAEASVVADLDGDGRLDLGAVAGNQVFVATPCLPPLGRDAQTRGRGQPMIARPTFAVRRVATLTLPPADFPLPPAIAAADVSSDGVSDLLILSSAGLHVGIAEATAAPVERSELAPFLLAPFVGARVRSVPAAPLDAARIGSAVLRAGQSRIRLAQASLAINLTPESAKLSEARPITLPLLSTLTRAELDNGVFRVFLEEQDLVSTTDPQSQIDPRFGTHARARLREVARRDPGAAGGALPEPVIDATAGTITFPIDTLGRYQVFIEAHPDECVLFRETFDAAGQSADGRAQLPVGWGGSAVWEAGTRSPGDPSRPLPVSAPNLLAVGLQAPLGLPDPQLQATLRTPLFPVLDVPAGFQVRLRMKHALDLDFGFGNPPSGVGSATVRAVTPSISDPDPVLATFTSNTAAAMSAVDIDVTAAIRDAFASSADDVSTTPGSIRLELQYTAGDFGTPIFPGLGWFIDDLELVLVPGP